MSTLLWYALVDKEGRETTDMSLALLSWLLPRETSTLPPDCPKAEQ
jgi:hypothetical protein